MKKLMACAAAAGALSLVWLTLTACGGGPSTTPSGPSPAASRAVVTTFAGKTGVSGSVDGTAAAARFDTPLWIALDPAGNLYVTQYDGTTIRKITPAGKVTTFAGKSGTSGTVDGVGGAARFNGAQGIASDAAGNLYVTADAGTIRKVTPAGKVTTLAVKIGSGSHGTPSCLAVDGAGNLYVSSDNDSTISKITPAGVVTTLAGKAGVSGSADGTGAAASFGGPSGIASDAAGNLYVADTDNNTIRKVTPAGVVTTFAGEAGPPGYADGMGGAARFDSPQGICVDADGNLYVTDFNNSTVRKITPVGQVTTIAGAFGVIGSANGRGAAASFNNPVGIISSRGGNLYVCDSGNDTIRRITLRK